MLISSASAHAILGGESPGHHGPFILLGIVIVVFLVLYAEKKWKRSKLRLKKSAEDLAKAEDDEVQ